MKRARARREAEEAARRAVSEAKEEIQRRGVVAGEEMRRCTTMTEVRKTYRRHSLRLHPDKFPRLVVGEEVEEEAKREPAYGNAVVWP